LILKDINSYLTELSKQLVIEPTKKSRIETSISFLAKSIWGHFQSRLSEVTIFGSFDRETIITVDKEADVDTLIVFKQKEVQPETYLKQLREFCENNYSRSEIYQDHPTIVIEMEHIKFELVPSYLTSDDTKKIPAPKTKEFKWISTSPTEFKRKVENKDRDNKGLIKPLIRIFKYWNLLNDKPFSSYELERIIVNKLYTSTTLREYYFSATNSILEAATTEIQKKKCAGLKERNRRLRALEDAKLPEYIETELMTFLPLI